MGREIDIRDFERVYRAHYTRMYYFAYDFIGNIEVCKDLVSEAFSRIWADRQNIDAERVEKLLFVMVRNLCLNYLRHQKSNRRYMDYCRASMEEAEENNIGELEEHIKEVEQELGKMSARTRYIMEECCLNGRSYKEIADVLEISTSGVKKHVIKAYAQLREHFNVKKRQNK